MRDSKRKMRWWIPGLILVLLGSLLVWLHETEHMARDLAKVVLPVAGVFLIALWYIFLTGLPWRRRILGFLVVVGIVLLGVGILSQTRWEGSVSGGALPRLVWKWTPAPDAVLEALEPVVDGVREGALDAGALPGLHLDYAQFMGPDRTGVLEGIELETDWEAHPPEELWRVPVGLGWSGFAVKGRYAVTQEQRGEDEWVTCYDLLTGDLLWAHADGARFVETMGGDGPRATPTIDGDKVFVLGATGILNCLELLTGKLIWSCDVLAENDTKNLFYGKTSSPLMVGDLVVVTGGETGPAVMAYRAESGEEVWKQGTSGASYASPQLVELGGREQIVSVNADTVTGHDPAKGEELWRYDWPVVQGFPRSSQAGVFDGNRLLLTASYGYDNYAIEVPADSGAVKTIWEGRPMRTKFSNVCLREGYGYGLHEGRLACVDLETGEQVWKGGKYGYGQNLLVGDVLLIQGERGFVALAAARPEGFTELARMDALTAKTWNYPTLAGSYLLVRNDVEAICFRLPTASASVPLDPEAP